MNLTTGPRRNYAKPFVAVDFRRLTRWNPSATKRKEGERNQQPRDRGKSPLARVLIFSLGRGLRRHVTVARPLRRVWRTYTCERHQVMGKPRRGKINEK